MDALALDGGPVRWTYGEGGTVVVPVPAGEHLLVLHAVLPGSGPWRVTANFPFALDAPGLAVEPVEGGFVARSPPGLSAAPLVVGAGFVALLAAVLLAARDRPAPEDGGLLGHLAELQRRLRVALAAFGLLLVAFLGLGVGEVALGSLSLPVPSFEGPTVAELAYRGMVEDLVPAGVTLVVLRPADAVMAEIWVAILLAALASAPVLAYEAAAFLGPALLPRERRLALRLVLPVLLLFLGGAAFGYALVVPAMLRTLYAFAPGIGAAALLSAPDLVGFAAILALLLGIAFELPVVMAALARARIVRPGAFASAWRHAVVAIFVIAAIITPDPTIVGQLFVAVPMTVLYAAGVGVAFLAARKGEGPEGAAR